MLARYLLSAVLLLPLVTWAQDSDDSDSPKTPEEAMQQVRDDAAGGSADDQDPDDGLKIGEMTDEEAAQKAAEARQKAEESQRQAEEQRQQADEAQERAERVRGVQE